MPHYRSYLIVILPSGQERRFEESFPGRVHELGKPSSVDVLESHVGPATLPGVRDDQALVERLEALWPPTVARVAGLVRERLTTEVDPVDIVRAALDDETVGQSDKLRAVIEEKQQAKDAEWLSLLLSAAVLEGSSPQHIAAASDVLMKHNKINAADEAVPTLRASPFARLRRLEGWFDLGRRGLFPPGIGGEVLRHFWREHPDLHIPMRSWLTELHGTLRALEREELEQLADRAAELAAEGGAGLALRLAADWAKTKAGRESEGQRTSTASADKSRRSIAMRLLTTAATDSALGRQVREQLWRWSRDGSADQKLLTAEVCAGIGAAFPRNALTRLKHLANSDNEDVRDAVLRALRQLGDDLGVSRLLRYLTEWFDKPSPGRMAILATAVGQVFAEQSIPVEADAAELFWRHAVTHMPPDNLQVMVSSWLHVTAQLHPDDRSSMLEPLVQATGGKARYIAYVQYASKPQPVSLDVDYFPDEAVAEVTQQLWTRLDEIDPIWAEG